MCKLVLAFMLLISLNSLSQDSPRGQQDSLNNMINKNLSYSDSLQKAEDIKRMTERSVNYFSQLQKQREAKQKRQAILYIAMGIVFLVILVVGLRRRVKKQG